MSNSFFDWPASSSRFVRFDAARAEDVNTALDEVSTGFDGVEAQTSASIRVPSSETIPALGTPSTRYGKILSFNISTGAPETTYSIADVTTVSNNITSINTVAGVSSDISTCASNIAAINNAPTYASNASSSATLASNWAIKTDGAVSGGEYSAKYHAQNAAASANSALSAPGTNATSTTSLTVGTGSKSFVIQTGKAYAIGQFLIIASTASPSNYMQGQVTAHNSSTGDITVNVTAIGGTGTFASWTVSLTATSAGSGITGTGISVDNEIVLFSGTSGGAAKRASTTGILKGTSGVLSAATAGTDYVAPGTATTFTATQTFKGVTDTVYTITDGAAFEINPANGAIQVVTLGASRTPAATNFVAGQSVLLGIDDGTSAYTIIWSTVNPTWVKAGGSGAAPALATTGYTWVLLWKVGSTIYAANVGSP